MKRILLALAVGMLFAGILYVLVIRKDHAEDPLNFLPGDTLALVDVRQPAALYGKYRQSRLGLQFNNIRWGDLLRQFGVSEEKAGGFQSEVDQVQAFLDGPLFRELFTRRAVLALLPIRPGSSSFTDPWESLVLIARPRHRTEAVELLAPLLTDDNRYATETYLGRDIRTFSLAEDTVLAVVASDGLLLASFSADTVKRCLDLALQSTTGKNRLKDNQEYLALQKRAAGRDEQFVYGDGQAVIRLLRSISSLGPGMDDQSVFPWEGGLGHGAFFCGTEMDRLDCAAILQAAPAGRGEGMPQPAIDDSFSVAPAELLLHYWTNLLDLSRVVEGLQHIPQLKDLLDRSELWLVRKSGMSFSEFFSLFDGQISLTVTGMRGNGFFPLPRLCCRLTIRDQERLRQALTSILAGRPQASRTVAGVRIHTLMLAGGLLQPSWAINDGIAFFADSPEQIEQSLLPPEAPLAETPLFRQADVGLEESNNMIAYVDYPRFLNGLQQLVLWGATILVMIDQEQGGRVRALVDLVVTPVLDGMKMFAAGSSRLLVAPSELVMESALVFADQAVEVE